MTSCVAFIDIDGVFLPSRSYLLPQNAAEVREMGGVALARPERLRFDQEAIENLGRLVAQVPELRLVLCSSWRHSVGTEQVIDLFERHQIGRHYWHAYAACPWLLPSPDAEALGVTSGSSKSTDILAWLHAHGSDILSWIVLDDDSDLPTALRSAPVPGAVILIDGRIGLSRVDVAAAIKALAPGETSTTSER